MRKRGPVLWREEMKGMEKKGSGACGVRAVRVRVWWWRGLCVDKVGTRSIQPSTAPPMRMQNQVVHGLCAFFFWIFW